MFNRKTCKKTARKRLFRHYLLFACLCLIAGIIGTEYASSYSSASNKISNMINGNDGEGSSFNNSWQLNSVLSNAIADSDTDLSAASDKLLSQASAQMSTIFGQHIEIGHNRGVLASVTNQVSSGAFALTLLSAVYSVVGSSRAATVILILLSFAVTALIWFFFISVFKVVYARVFLEGRIYDRIPLQRMTFLIGVRKWTKAAWTMFVKMVYYSLWVLTVVGGFIKYFSYFAVPYIVAENPTLSANTAITLSRQMMKGHKWECFKLSFSFIGWSILDALTFGLVGIFYSNPYKEAVYCEYYSYVRSEAIKNGVEHADLLNDTYLYEPAPIPAIAGAYGALEDYPNPPLEKKRGLWYHLKDFFGVYFVEANDRHYKTEQCERIRYQNVKNIYDHQTYPARLYPIPVHERRSTMEHLYYTRRYSIWSLIILFFLFSLIGWLWEVSLHLISDGTFVNRGVLHGPWLPIYGTGGITALLFLNKLRKKPIFEFFSAILLCGIIEYSIGWYLEFSHGGQKWWDYQGYFLNIDGRVCAEGLLVFGLGCVAVVYFIAPMIDNLIQRIPRKGVIAFCIVFLLIFLSDKIYSGKHPNTGKGITSFHNTETVELLTASNPTPLSGST